MRSETSFITKSKNSQPLNGSRRNYSDMFSSRFSSVKDQLITQPFANVNSSSERFNFSFRFLLTFGISFVCNPFSEKKTFCVQLSHPLFFFFGKYPFSLRCVCTEKDFSKAGEGWGWAIYKREQRY